MTISYANLIVIVPCFLTYFYATGHDVPEEVWWPLLILWVKSSHAAITVLFLIISIIRMAFAVSIARKIHSISVFLFLALILESDYCCFWVPKLPCEPCCPFCWEFASERLPHRLIFGRPSLAHRGCGYPICCTELSVGLMGICGIWCHTSNPYIHKLLLHADTVLQAYTLSECRER